MQIYLIRIAKHVVFSFIVYLSLAKATPILNYLPLAAEKQASNLRKINQLHDCTLGKVISIYFVEKIVLRFNLEVIKCQVRAYIDLLPDCNTRIFFNAVLGIRDVDL